MSNIKRPLPVLQGDHTESRDPPAQRKRRSYREEAQAKFERLWLLDPEQFNPLRTAMQRSLLDTTWNIVASFMEWEGKKVADLGTGMGVIARRLAKLGASVHAVDIATQPLQNMQQESLPGLTPMQDYVPRTTLSDDFYDVVVSTELIGFLPPEEHRLFFSELARIVKNSGALLCSTAIDIHSEDALERFAGLVDTEFSVRQWVFSYHAYFIHLGELLKAPAHFARAKADPEYRLEALKKRLGFYKKWFWLQSTPLFGTFWKAVAWILKPCIRSFEQSKGILLFLEKVCRFVKNEGGISHAFFIGEKRPLTAYFPKEPVAERKSKKTVWE